MTLYQFRSLDHDSQAAAVWNGVFLTQRREEHYQVQLYATGSFFVEVYYSMALNEIVKLRPFKSAKVLSPYLAQIQVDYE